jgi:hypothetical protein
MAEKKTKNENPEERPRSPINGQPLPKGHQWETSEEAREAGRKGGKRSGEVRRARKTLRDELTDLLTETITDKNGRVMQTQKAISTSLIKQALTGSTKAFEIIRDTIGERPIEKVMVAEVDQATIDEVEAMIFGEELAPEDHPEDQGTTGEQPGNNRGTIGDKPGTDRGQTGDKAEDQQQQ